MKNAAPSSAGILRSLGIVAASVSFAACAALFAIALVAANWMLAAVTIVAAGGIAVVSWNFYRGKAGSRVWPMMSVWTLTAALMLTVLLISR